MADGLWAIHRWQVVYERGALSGEVTWSDNSKRLLYVSRFRVCEKISLHFHNVLWRLAHWFVMRIAQSIKHLNNEEQKIPLSPWKMTELKIGTSRGRFHRNKQNVIHVLDWAFPPIQLSLHLNLLFVEQRWCTGNGQVVHHAGVNVTFSLIAYSWSENENFIKDVHFFSQHIEARK